jgi:hypothetical protein
MTEWYSRWDGNIINRTEERAFDHDNETGHHLIFPRPSIRSPVPSQPSRSPKTPPSAPPSAILPGLHPISPPPPFQRFSFQHLPPAIPVSTSSDSPEFAIAHAAFSFTQIPLFPASGPATGSLNGLHPKSKFLATASCLPWNGPSSPKDGSWRKAPAWHPDPGPLRITRTPRTTDCTTSISPRRHPRPGSIGSENPEKTHQKRYCREIRNPCGALALGWPKTAPDTSGFLSRGVRSELQNTNPTPP